MANALGTLALQLGFASRELWYAQRRVWDTDHWWDENAMGMKRVKNVIKEIAESLIGLKSRRDDAQVEGVADIQNRIIHRHIMAEEHVERIFEEIDDAALSVDDAKSLFAKKLNADNLCSAWKVWQKDDWASLRNRLMGAVSGESRLLAWFEIGDRSAKAVYELWPLPIPPSDFDLAYIYEPMNVLRGEERRAVEGLVPFGDYKDTHDLALKIRGTFRAICKLLDDHEGELLAVPQWTGTDLVFRGKRASIRNQNTSVITIFLEAFQRQGWPDTVSLPASAATGEQSKNAIYEFNKKHVIKLSQTGGSISWSGEIRSRSE